MTDEKKTAPFENCICRQGPPEETMMDMDGGEKQLARPKLLLHSCCGPCSTSCVERLAADYEITVFFYNPNITDRVEYEKRKENQIRFIEAYNEKKQAPFKVSFMEGDYDTEAYIRLCGPFADEPEGSHRCELCFRKRLEKTAETAAMLNFDTFTTTLTVSPHKAYDVISSIGRKVADIYKVGYLDIDFKKKDGFKRSIELSREYGLYRQNYCGCEWSKWDDDEKGNETEKGVEK